MTHRTVDSTMEQNYLGFAIREQAGVYVGVPMDAQVWRIFEAETRNVLEYKIRRWWVSQR